MGNLVNGCVILICMAMFNMTGEAVTAGDCTAAHMQVAVV